MYLSNIKRLEIEALSVAILLHIAALLIYCLLSSVSSQPEFQRTIIKINLGISSAENSFAINNATAPILDEKFVNAAPVFESSFDKKSKDAIPNKSPVGVTSANEENAEAAPETSTVNENVDNTKTEEAAKAAKDYLSMLQLTVQQKSNIPAEAAMNNIYGRAVLRLEFDRKGYVKNFKLKQSTGHEILDNAAISVATKLMSEPFPAPPEDFYPNEKLLKFDFGIDYDPINQ